MRSGSQLRKLRQQRGLTLRQVQFLTQQLAKKHGNTRLAISTTRLLAMENTNAVPNLFRVWALARVYQCGVRDIFKYYGLRFPR